MRLALWPAKKIKSSCWYEYSLYWFLFCCVPPRVRMIPLTHGGCLRYVTHFVSFVVITSSTQLVFLPLFHGNLVLRLTSLPHFAQPWVAKRSTHHQVMVDIRHWEGQ